MLVVIDAQGFRPNVGIVLANDEGQLLWARRVRRDGWQFPQGGVDSGETPQQAMYRELHEEVGLLPEQVKLLACTHGWLRYRLPGNLRRTEQAPSFVGQKQKWFLLRLLDEDGAVSVDRGHQPEFDQWRWVSYWYPLSQIIFFKREVYRKALGELVTPLARASRSD